MKYLTAAFPGLKGAPSEVTLMADRFMKTGKVQSSALPQAPPGSLLFLPFGFLFFYFFVFLVINFNDYCLVF